MMYVVVTIVPRLSVSKAGSGPWTTVLETTLVDSREQEDPLPLQTLGLGKTVDANFIKFDLLEYYGNGGGLQYLNIERQGKMIPFNPYLKFDEIIKGVLFYECVLF